MAATLGQLGRIDEARGVLAEMERKKPINTVSLRPRPPIAVGM